MLGKIFGVITGSVKNVVSGTVSIVTTTVKKTISAVTGIVVAATKKTAEVVDKVSDNAIDIVNLESERLMGDRVQPSVNIITKVVTSILRSVKDLARKIAYKIF